MSLFTTPEVVIAYPKLFQAVLRKNPNPKDKPQFSAAFLFSQAAYDDPLTLKIREALTEAAVAKWGKAAVETMQREGSLDSPFKRDISAKGYPAGVVRYINCAANQEYPPGVFGRDIDPSTKRPRVLTDTREFYHGTLVRVSVTIRAYGGPGTAYKAGLKLDLRNVQKLRDGERLQLGSGGSDGSEFDALPPIPAADMPSSAAGGPLAGMLD